MGIACLMRVVSIGQSKRGKRSIFSSHDISIFYPCFRTLRCGRIVLWGRISKEFEIEVSIDGFAWRPRQALHACTKWKFISWFIGFGVMGFPVSRFVF